MSRGSNKGFNTPFSDLKKKLEESRRLDDARKRAVKTSRDERECRGNAGARGEAQGTEAPRTLDASADPNHESALFHSWVRDVEPLPPKGTKRVLRAKRSEPPRGTSSADEDAEVIAALFDLVAGEGDFEISDTDEYVEGLAPGIDRRLLKRLRQGDFSVQAHLDLHGMVREQAKESVEAFIRSSRLAGKRCVIIVHGRGLRSPGREPVLKKALVRWLSRASLGKQVLAFASTLPHDGGAGAIYVLLRR